MNNQQESKNIKLNNSDFTFLADQKSWLKIPADGSPLTFTGNADEAAKEFFNALIRVRDGYISALKAERDALAVENQALKKFGDKLNEMHNDLNGEGTGIQGRAEVVCQQAAIEAAMDEFDAITTPATSAALAAIQAQGVEKFAEFLDSPIDGQHCYQNEVGLARHFASTLREAK
ncbi:TPA: hypothetical protein ACKP84_003812 [Serratia marcescens]|nr:hypothetical protein [Serratia marcescens]HEJ7006146.1 hypothetical protein [Serratia marcescens]